MKRLLPTLYIFLGLSAALVATPADAALELKNGNFDQDADLGAGEDETVAPTGWFIRYSEIQSWNEFRIGAIDNGGWTKNGIAFGQNYLGTEFIPGPEDGYFYTSLGGYTGETKAIITGSAFNRINGNLAGNFDIGLYFSSSFIGADGQDVAGKSTLLGKTVLDVSTLTGTTAMSRDFSWEVMFAGSGIAVGDQVWLRLGDGPDDGDLTTFDEPIIDNLALTTSLIVALCGDVDKDQDIDSVDLLGLLENWTGATVAGGKSFDQGDCDNDGDVDSLDMLAFISNWTGQKEPLVESAGGSLTRAVTIVVPEPATGALIAWAGLLVMATVRNRHCAVMESLRIAEHTLGPNV